MTNPSKVWNEASLLDWAESKNVSETDRGYIRDIVRFAEKQVLGPQWPTSSVPVFAVRGRDQFFKVNGHGRIIFPFSRLKADEGLFQQLVNRLNEALGDDAFSVEAMGTKSLGWLLSERFDSSEELREFLLVWIWFADEQLRREGR
jgi:hypothetical protein